MPVLVLSELFPDVNDGNIDQLLSHFSRCAEPGCNDHRPHGYFYNSANQRISPPIFSQKRSGEFISLSVLVNPQNAKERTRLETEVIGQGIPPECTDEPTLYAMFLGQQQ